MVKKINANTKVFSFVYRMFFCGKKVAYINSLILFISIAGGDLFAATELSSSPSITNINTHESKWLIVLEDPRSKRQQGWKSGQYNQSNNYKDNLAFKRLTQSMLQDHPIHLITEWPIPSIKAHCLVVTMDQEKQLAIISKLTDDPRVKWVQKYQSFKAKSQQPSIQIKQNENILLPKVIPKSKIDNTDPYLKLQASFKQLNLVKVVAALNGNGVNIAMIDSGVDEQHPELQGVLKEQIDFVDPGNKSPPAERHGTGIAGVIVAKKYNGEGIAGISPAANLYAYRACWETKQGSTDCDTLTLARALDRVASLQPDILNLSLTGPKDQLLESIIQVILKNGTQIIAAYDSTRSLTDRFPLMQQGVIFVDDISNQLSIEESHLSNPIYFAPGHKILTTQPGGTYDFISGSSMATANVSSLFALIKQTTPSADLEQLGDALFKYSSNPEILIINDVCHLVQQFSYAIDCQLNP